MRSPEVRCDVLSMEQLLELVDAPLPAGSRGFARPRAQRSLFRDLHLDTADGALRSRGVSCRLRIGADDRRRLLLRIADRREHDVDGAGEHHASSVRSAEAIDALREPTTVGRRLRALVDPARLTVRADLEIERYARVARRDWLGRPALVLLFEQVTVRHGSQARSFQQLRIRPLRASRAEAESLALAFEQQHGLRRTTADTRTRAELLLKWMRNEGSLAPPSRDGRPSVLVPQPATERSADAPPFLNSELSLLEFQSRVLAMAEDSAAPLGERLRFLSIVSSNLDEFFGVRVAGLRDATRELREEQSEEALSRQAQLALIATRVAVLVARQYRAHRECMASLADAGVRVRAWAELDEAARAELRAHFREEVYPALTPLAMTLAPGHPFPNPPHLSLSLAAVLLDRYGGAPRLACVDLPRELARVLPVPGSADVVLLEEVVRANLDALYPGSRVEQVYAYRATRGADIALDEDSADDLRDAVDEATRQRGGNAIVRVEVERAMPLVIRDLVLAELRAEAPAGTLQLSHADLYEIDGPLDLRHLSALPLPPALTPRDAATTSHDDGEPLWAAIRDRDLLLHHPFDPFARTVQRFFADAASDPDVVSIKTTLYRTGDHSPIVDALREAAARGKQVAVFVELKARFDEERNVAATRTVEEAGARVVYGLVGLKNHAKVTLVARREGGRLRRYVHVGTGNYNAVTARQYTDLSLFSADEGLAEDVSRFFNELTGTSRPPERLEQGALVAPKQLLPAILERIEREARNARAGRPAGIRLKLNGLSHPEVIRALYRASQAGVRIDLVVRGVCTLCPGVAGFSERIRVLAIVGRLLEHSRIYHFVNGGEGEYLIGSSDLRPRNLRRRIELLVPVRDARGRALLDRLLDLYLADPTGWELQPGGEYVQRRGDGASTQERLLREAATCPLSVPDTRPRSPASRIADRL